MVNNRFRNPGDPLAYIGCPDAPRRHMNSTSTRAPHHLALGAPESRASFARRPAYGEMAEPPDLRSTPAAPSSMERRSDEPRSLPNPSRAPIVNRSLRKKAADNTNFP